MAVCYDRIEDADQTGFELIRQKFEGLVSDSVGTGAEQKGYEFVRDKFEGFVPDSVGTAYCKSNDKDCTGSFTVR